jgi:hypothetical protein
MEVSGQLKLPDHLTSGERAPYIRWVRGWVGLITGLDAVRQRNFLPLPGIETRPFSPQLIAIPTELQRL